MKKICGINRFINTLGTTANVYAQIFLAFLGVRIPKRAKTAKRTRAKKNCAKTSAQLTPSTNPRVNPLKHMQGLKHDCACRDSELTTAAGTCPATRGCPGVRPICCRRAFFSAKWLRPLIKS